MKTCECCDEILDDEHFEIEKEWKKFGYDTICVFCSIQLWREREDARWARRQTPDGKAKLKLDQVKYGAQKREYDKKYYQEHQEKIKNRSSKWYRDNPEKAKEQRKKQAQKYKEDGRAKIYRKRSKEKRKEKIKAYNKAYYHDNKEDMTRKALAWRATENGRKKQMRPQDDGEKIILKRRDKTNKKHIKKEKKMLLLR